MSSASSAVLGFICQLPATSGSGAALLDISVAPPRSAAYSAASAAGAKETTSTRGSASRRCVTERAQEATLASARTGVPAKSKISWGGQAPGRLGRGDARKFGGATLSFLENRDAWQLPAFQVLEGCTTACRHVREASRQTQRSAGRHSIAAPDQREATGLP